MAESKKRKLSSELQPNGMANGVTNGELHTAKPTAVFTPKGGRSHTVSVAIPGSIIANAKSHDQKTHLAGTIARALAVFCVDEVIIFEDDHSASADRPRNPKFEDEYTAFTHPSHFLAHLLSYVETPPHLRRHLFPMHRNLSSAGTLPSLDMPHHVRAHEWCEYREGVTLVDNEDAGGGGGGGGPKKKKYNHKKKHKLKQGDASGTWVYTGLPQPTLLEGVSIPPHTRLTLKFRTDKPSGGADAVSPSTPREETGYYWGYSVRRCASLSAVFMECPFEGGYDVSFGTSERGASLASVVAGMDSMPSYKHLLLVFGGVAGLEAAVLADKELGLRPEQAGEVFDYYVNVLPGQGSRTIRTEEAVWLGLMGLEGVIREKHQ